MDGSPHFSRKKQCNWRPADVNLLTEISKQHKKPFYHVCINDLKICKQQSCKRMPIHAQLLIQGCEEITTINKKDVKGMSAINTSDDQSHQESLLIARLLGRRLWNLPGIRRSSKRKRPQDF